MRHLEMVTTILLSRKSPRLQHEDTMDTILQRKLSAKRKSLTLSGEKMQQLVEDYWVANKNNRHKVFPHFYQCVSQALTRYNCNCNGRHCCELRNCWTTPPSLIALLQRHLYIEVEGMADVLHH